MEDVIVVEGQPNEPQAKPTQEEAAAAKATADAAKIAADKKAAEDRLLDSNGNPKSAEVIKAEEEAARAKEIEEDGSSKEAKDLETKVKNRAKQVEDLVKAAGVKPEDLISSADPETGVISVDHKAKLITEHGEAIADLIEGSIQKMIGDIKTATVAKDQSVYNQLEKEFEGITEQSGKETWKELSGWVKDNVDVKTRKEYNVMLSAGGMQAQLAIREMVNSFKKENDTTVEAKLLSGDDAAPMTGGFITRPEYKVALEKLLDSGHDYNTSPEVAALNNKRAKSMRMGK